jgi:hypothetical protein
LLWEIRRLRNQLRQFFNDTDGESFDKLDETLIHQFSSLSKLLSIKLEEWAFGAPLSIQTIRLTLLISAQGQEHALESML